MDSTGRPPGEPAAPGAGLVPKQSRHPGRIRVIQHDGDAHEAQRS